MPELFERLHAALPELERWIDVLCAQHGSQSRPASESEFPRLRTVVPEEVLTAARFALVDSIPFPPVHSYGLPEFESMAAMPMAGITFRNFYFVHKDYSTEGLHLHELVHIIQWRTLGVRPFLLTYALGIVQYGYETSPFEAIASDYHVRFERGLSIQRMCEEITQHAIQTGDAAAAVYAANGIDIRN